MDTLGHRRGAGPFLFLLALAGAVAPFVGAVAPLQAQQTTGSIRIEVRDASGGGVQASLRLASQVVESDSQGVGEFRNLAPGHYRIEISKTGFATQKIEVDIKSATPVLRSVTLAIGAGSSRVDVVAATPLAGTDLSRNQIAGPVQTATAADIESSGGLDLTDFMNRRLNGVYINESQENPYQPDVNFRGYTASPLLGTPEGISVYLDGVRQNQPFGDVVSWDLIPKNAISEITLIPGSDPLFGLNSLGGALSVRTKDGLSDPGIEGTATYGSSGRKAVQASYGGGKATGFNWFLAANGFHESGWRIASPSDVRQAFITSRLGDGAPIRPISRSLRPMPITLLAVTVCRTTGCSRPIIPASTPSPTASPTAHLRSTSLRGTPSATRSHFPATHGFATSAPRVSIPISIPILSAMRSSSRAVRK